MGQVVLLLLVFLVWAQLTLGSPQLLEGLASNLVGAVFHTAIGRDCKGRAEGDYFFGCQCVGPFGIRRRRRRRYAQFPTSNQGIGGDLIRCSIGSLLGNGKR